MKEYANWLHNNGEVIKAIEFIVGATLKLPLKINGNTLSENQRYELYNPLLNKSLKDMLFNYHYGLFYDGEVYFFKKERSFFVARKNEVQIKEGLLTYGKIITEEYYKIENISPITGNVEPRYKAIENELKEKYYSQSNNIKLLENGLLIRELIVFNKPINDSMKERIKAKLNNQYSQIKNRFSFGGAAGENSTTLVIDNNEMDYKTLSANLADIQNTALANENRDIIFNYIGVPPQLMGSAKSSTYANYKEAHKSFLENTVIPNAQILADMLTKWYYNNSEVVTVDISELEKKTNEINTFNEVQILYDEGLITREQFLEETGYGYLKGGEYEESK